MLYLWKKFLKKNSLKVWIIGKLEIIVIMQGNIKGNIYKVSAQNICNLKFNVPNEVPVVFHNGSS